MRFVWVARANAWDRVIVTAVAICPTIERAASALQDVLHVLCAPLLVELVDADGLQLSLLRIVLFLHPILGSLFLSNADIEPDFFSKSEGVNEHILNVGTVILHFVKVRVIFTLLGVAAEKWIVRVSEPIRNLTVQIFDDDCLIGRLSRSSPSAMHQRWLEFCERVSETGETQQLVEHGFLDLEWELWEVFGRLREESVDNLERVDVFLNFFLFPCIRDVQ